MATLIRGSIRTWRASRDWCNTQVPVEAGLPLTWTLTPSPFTFINKKRYYRPITSSTHCHNDEVVQSTRLTIYRLDKIPCFFQNI